MRRRTPALTCLATAAAAAAALPLAASAVDLRVARRS